MRSVYQDRPIPPTGSSAAAAERPFGESDTTPQASLERSRQLPDGDERLGALLQELRPRLTAVALRFTRDAEIAHDVVQSAFEKAIRHRDQFRGHARVSTWVHRIVANEALMWLRSERRRDRRTGCLSEANPEALVDPGPDPAAELAEGQARLQLRKGIARLGEEERDVIEGCVLRGRSYAEYGAERGVDPAAAKSRAFRARRHVQAILSEA